MRATQSTVTSGNGISNNILPYVYSYQHKSVTKLMCYTVLYFSAEKFIRRRSESVNFELDDNEFGGRESGT
jgi:hypothetical protein